jgi:PPM family protein phosphatase
VSYRVTLSGVSDIGRVRKRNEDSMSLVPTLGIAVIADGMGGHPGGDVASRIAASTVAACLEQRIGAADAAASPDPHVTVGALERAMVESVLSAHAAIRTESEDRPELSGMGTTLTALVLNPASGGFVVGHVGDSRAYRLRGDRLTPLTRDDTWVQTQVDAARMTPDQARGHPFGHVLTQCVGLEEEPYPHVLTGSAQAGDAYVLCTDGLVGLVDESDIKALLLTELGKGDAQDRGEAAARALVERAKESGGFDNITVVIALVE